MTVTVDDPHDVKKTKKDIWSIIIVLENYWLFRGKKKKKKDMSFTIYGDTFYNVLCRVYYLCHWH